MKIKIAVSCHKKTPFLQTDVFEPIHAGKALSSCELGISGDHTGIHISEKNRSWCELTVLYWLWKNVEADYYGLFHYRRFLNFSGGRKEGNFYDFDAATVDYFGWNSQKIRSLCEQYDVILPKENIIHVEGNPQNIMNQYDFYAYAHYQKDLDVTIDVIRQKSPDIFPAAVQALFSEKGLWGNVMVMRKDIFSAYAEWLFTILGEVEKRIDCTSYNPYQKRVFGFLGERLLSCYAAYLSTKKDIRKTSLPLVFGNFDNYQVNIDKIRENINSHKMEMKKSESDSTIHIAFCIDKKYIKQCSVSMASILKFSGNVKFNFHIVTDDSIGESSKNKIINSIKNYTNQEIFFYKVQKELFKIFPNNRQHISFATYYRLIIHRLLPDYIDKIVYLDADLIAVDNIEKLYSLDIDKYYIAGCYDEGGITQSRKLRLEYDHKYINAGVILMNLKKMREDNIEHVYLMSFLKKKNNITLQDQDIINISIQGNCAYLDLRWNANGRLYKDNKLEAFYTKDEAEYACMNPGIIHFTDNDKPWKMYCRHPLQKLYLDQSKEIEWRDNLLDHFHTVMEILIPRYNITTYTVEIMWLGNIFHVDKIYIRPFYNMWKSIRGSR